MLDDNEVIVATDVLTGKVFYFEDTKTACDTLSVKFSTMQLRLKDGKETKGYVFDIRPKKWGIK